jgi:dipeptidyl aminopeptidase/acylaminoacyl peptidase
MRLLVSAAVLLLLPFLVVAQEKTVPVPQNVKVEGMPPIPQSIADTFSLYAQFRSAQMQAWHPTKRQIIVTTGFGSAPQLHLVDGPGRDRHQMTWLPGGGVSPNLSIPSFDPADATTLVFAYDPAGGEARSLYRYDFTTGQAVAAIPAQIRYAPVWARQGKWLVYDSNERNGKDRDLYVVQPSDPKTKRRLAEFEGAGWSPQDWSPDGKTIVVNEVVSNSETYLWLVNVQSGERRPLTQHDGQKMFWTFARFSADGKHVYATSDRGGDTVRVWRGDLATGAWTGVTAAADNVSLRGGYELSPDGAQIAVVFDRTVQDELQVFDSGSMKARTLPALTGGQITNIRWRPGSHELAFTLASIKAPGDAYSIDTSLGTVTRWTVSEATFNTDVLPSPEIVSWKSADGLTVSGILYKPASRFTGRRPVLVQLHGGPDVHEQIRWQGRSNYFLNEVGVALLYPNVRGSDGFGRKFVDADNGRGRDGVIKDVGAMLDWIGTRPDLDADRVVLSGGSSGGWLALEAGIVYNNRIRGIMEGAGITDFITYLEQQTNPQRQESRRAEYGDERDPQMREYLKSISPLTRASELKKPTLIFHPGKDARVPVSQAQELVSALKANNAPVWYVEFADANHDNFPTTAANNDFMIQSWILFFQKFVLNDAPAGTTK